ncbi:hypothetical protein RHGRI_000565 [Rhododendron griersonianum]|uniref:At1g61320/AtMIF1 LRR domain-containing protein n=1 Tax=Rhododendron griersonianum TaxID=479676 RepID=A0AAV6LI39_9ERIC|nr:hypothetical protein RHGRI_000565 [Rhododendron griersonianum]
MGVEGRERTRDALQQMQVWTADCNSDGSQAVVGKFFTAAFVLVIYYYVEIIFSSSFHHQFKTILFYYSESFKFLVRHAYAHIMHQSWSCLGKSGNCSAIMGVSLQEPCSVTSTKAAIVERAQGFSLIIAQGKVPILAQRGELEGRVNELINDVKKSGLDITNLLKPPLGRGELQDANVNGELLEFLLSNCLLLETLCVFRSEHIVNLRVAGSSLQLKHLEIFQCKCLESLEVSTPNLVTFKYFGQRIRLHIGNLPLLSKLHIGGGYGHQVTYTLVAFSSHLSQIETLELEMFFKDNREIQVPQLTNLEHLKLKIFDDKSLSLLGLTSLLEAAPSLRKFTLEVIFLTRCLTI